MTYRRILYIFAIIKWNHFRIYMFGVVGKTHTHDYFEVNLFYNSKDILVAFSYMSFPLYYVICVICISKKLKTKQGNQKLKDNLLVILSVLSNKTNLILGFSSPLKTRGWCMWPCGDTNFIFNWVLAISLFVRDNVKTKI